MTEANFEKAREIVRELRDVRWTLKDLDESKLPSGQRKILSYGMTDLDELAPDSARKFIADCRVELNLRIAALLKRMEAL